MSASARSRRQSKGALFVIAALLGTAGLIRIGEGAGSAIALETPAAPPPEAEACEAPGLPARLVSALQDRERAVAKREDALADRMQALALTEAKVEERLASLIAAEENLAATLAIADTAAEADVARLTTVYESMKPKEAAPLFAEMAPDFAAGFLARMTPDAAAAILAGLEPRTSYSISVMLAGRNADAPKD